MVKWGIIMRVDSISYSVFSTSPVNINRKQGNKYTGVYVANHPELRVLSFTGNMWQFASLTPENNGLGLSEAAAGGEGVVGRELPASMNNHLVVEGKKADARSFMPIWQYNNPNGGHRFLLHKGIKTENLPDTMPDKLFITAAPGQDIHDVAKFLKVNVEDLDYVVQSKPNGSGPEAQSRFCIIEPTSIKGSVTSPSTSSYGASEEVPYQLFKISDKNHQKYFKLNGNHDYFLYTPDLAKSARPYTYGPGGTGSFDAEVINSRQMKALAEIILTKMDTDEFGHFKPATVICHDRPSSTFMLHAANMSARGINDANGVVMHKVEHNPGRNYQGVTDDPFKMFAVVARDGDEKLLRNHPQAAILRKAFEFGINSDKLTDEERKIASKIILPYVEPFKDGAGTYNITKIPIVYSKLNKQNMSLGTVSHQFDREMKSQDTPDAAKFLTDDYATLETKSVLNGSTPANLRLDDPECDFGKGYNGLSANKKGFKTFKYNGENIREIISFREQNARWFTNLIYKAYQEGSDSLRKLFFNQTQLDEGQKVIGYLRPMKEGDILVMGWGRPDEQKGFNITLDGFKKFLQRKDVPQADKLKFRVVTGAGKWDEGAKDYKSIVRIIKEIETMDGGIYKGSVMHVDGFFPNRLVACAQYGGFTSRREMCGITPLECKAAGVPYFATATGGPVDYTNPLNGYLTNEVVEGRPERYGLTYANTADEIDDARCARQSEQVSDIFVKLHDEYTNHFDDYVAKCKKGIEEKVDWHENSEFNRGKSALRTYAEDIAGTDKGWKARHKATLKEAQGKLGQYSETLENLKKTVNSKPVKLAIGLAIAALTIGSGIYIYILKRKNKALLKQQELVA